MIEKPKISDIASQSGVSVSTVSLVLNNKPGVSQDTRQRVLEIADQLGYPSKAKPVNGIQAKPDYCGHVGQNQSGRTTPG
jgi:DNA-binding LacI/PurR family transcriptional regulator